MVHMERKAGRDEGMVVRKGPWMAEEDEILIDYVNKYGPRDWSSIRSKGLLPRTGKSCRLRWVNKLKPNLKTGFKFSAEEERIVIDLQARFGNKWARIATYLEGRTDNDVKNFWSTRQKRLARMMERSLPPNLQHKHGKLPIVGEKKLGSELSCTPGHDQFIPCGEESSTSHCGNNSCNLEDSESTRMVKLSDLMGPNILMNLETELLPPEPDFDRKPCFLSNPPQKFPFPQAKLDPPILTEGEDLLTGFLDMNFEDPFACREEASGIDLFPEGILSTFELEGDCSCSKRDYETPNVPDNFFDDFPVDMFDYLEPHPNTKET